jgi:TrpR-related protein YerC/YecD
VDYLHKKESKDLFKALLLLKTEDEVRRFLRDLLTEAEIKEFANRWAVARLLEKKMDYESITKKTGMSSTTIARINKWKEKGMGGYKLMLKRFMDKNSNKKNIAHHNTPLLAV